LHITARGVYAVPCRRTQAHGGVVLRIPRVMRSPRSGRSITRAKPARRYTKSAERILYNVPAVGDVFAARIRALRSKDQGWQNVPEQRRGNERSD
jgi:hypothetical protein